MKLRPSNLSCRRCIAVVATVVAVSALQSDQPRIRGASQPVSQLSSLGATARTRVATAYGQLPLAFEQNQGQTSEEVKFLSRGAGYTLFLTSADAVLALRKTSHEGNPAQTVLRMKLRGGSPASRVAGRGELPGRTNYLIGRDPEKWRRGVARFERVEYENVYPGVNLVYYGNQRQLEYDFIVSPGADPQRIRLAFDGLQTLRIDDRGDLVLETRTDPVRLQKPVIYQEIDGRRQQIAGGYLLEDTGDVTFQVGSYDATRPLIIDPVLVYSTYLGGTGHDLALDIAVDAMGNAYVVGNTLSTDFPVNNAVQPTCTTIELPGYTSCDDMFVTKLNRDGTAIEVLDVYRRHEHGHRQRNRGRRIGERLRNGLDLVGRLSHCTMRSSLTSAAIRPSSRKHSSRNSVQPAPSWSTPHTWAVATKTAGMRSRSTDKARRTSPAAPTRPIFPRRARCNRRREEAWTRSWQS